MIPTASGQSECDVPSSDVRGGVAALAVIVGGIPAYFARDGRSDIGAGISSLGPNYEGERDAPSFALEGSAYGGWGRFGYRVGWFDTSYQLEGCRLGHTNSSIGLVTVPVRDDGRELRLSLGPGYGLLPRPSFSVNVGLHFEEPIAKRLFFSADAIYLPNRTDENVLQHASRLSLRLRWHATTSFQPYVAAVGGTTDTGVAHMGAPIPRGVDSGRPGIYMSAILGFESRWGPDN